MLFNKKDKDVFKTDDSYFVQIDYPDDENRGEIISQHFDFDDAEKFLRETLQPETSVTIFVVQKEGRKFVTDDNVFVEELFTGETYENLMKAFVDEMFNSRNFDEYAFQDKINYLKNELFPEYLKYFSKDEIPNLPTEDEAESGEFYSVVPMFEQMRLNAISASENEETNPKAVVKAEDETILEQDELPDEVDSLEALNSLTFGQDSKSSSFEVSAVPISQPVSTEIAQPLAQSDVIDDIMPPEYRNDFLYHVKFPRFEIHSGDIPEIIALKEKFNAEIEELERQNSVAIQKKILFESSKLEEKNAEEFAKKSEILDNSDAIKAKLEKKHEANVQEIIDKNVQKLEIELNAEIEKLKLQFQMDKSNIENQSNRCGLEKTNI
ncbi:hypothetical protein FACS1894192_12120 [Bacilli bacterium]|nr:hypothetical protein FACS1894192_12120 [Bacilli bacterium]